MARRQRRYAAGEAARRRHAWLELVQTSGPFLTLPVVDRVWPDGLPAVASEARRSVRTAVAEAMESHGAARYACVRAVLGEALDWAGHLTWATEVPASLAEPVPEHGAVLTPSFAFHAEPYDADPSDTEVPDPDGPAVGEWRMLGMVSEWGTHPLTRTTADGWTASPVERLAVLLRARDVPVGLVTDGRWWSLVWAPVGGTTGAAVWDATLFSEEPESFRAFVGLLTRARFLAVAAEDTLPALFEESLGAQEEVTETLGLQVRDAVELLLETLDRLDADSGFLDGVTDDDLYDGVVTLMMRVVFLLFAEERRLLPSDDDVYVAAYSVGRLVEQLETTDSALLEHRTGAWHRLLATSRALHAGVAHEDLRLPAYGGGLFDPDRFPWLEGRSADDDPSARPPAVDDATVLRLLRAVQYVEIGGQRRRLTFRALDVEQIGYVYEGLLELEVRTAKSVMLHLSRPREWPKSKEPSDVALDEAAGWLNEAPARLRAQLKARTGRTDSRLEKDLAAVLEAHERAALRRRVGDELAERILPLAPVLRWDELGRPAVTLPGRRYVAPSLRRAATGTHYTPRSLAEDVAGNALEPLCYRPGPLETTDRETWRIQPSTTILGLRVADIAMGSGAFLVAACRYLADRLVEAWEQEGRADAVLSVRHTRQGRLSADAEMEQISLEARRLVAEQCLYGVDINPLAVEMAKLSLWLVTMDRERPFGFLDDRLVPGDSLLGLTSLAQLERLHMEPSRAESTLDQIIRADELSRAADLRRRITAHGVTTGRDVEYKSRLLAQARAATHQLEAVADAVVGVGLRAGKLKGRKMDVAFTALGVTVAAAAPEYADGLHAEVAAVQAGRPDGVVSRDPLHWPLAFPEVFADTTDLGFDAIIGNPPFMGGQDVSGNLGTDYLNSLQLWDGKGIKGSADLSARFVLRACCLLNTRGQIAYIAINTLAEGATLRVGLGQVVGNDLTIRKANSSHPWPTRSANIEIVAMWGSRAPVLPHGIRTINDEVVDAIGADLQPVGRILGTPKRLRENEGIAFKGIMPLGLGFTLTEHHAQDLISFDSSYLDVLQPYLIGDDLNQRPDSSASRWIINFGNQSLNEAKRYPLALEIVETLVKPHRIKASEPYTRGHWWLFQRTRPEMTRALSQMTHALVMAQTSNALQPIRLPIAQAFDQKCVVFATEKFDLQAVLSSSFHLCWTVRYAATMRVDLSYAHTDVFLTFPRPQSTLNIHQLGKRLDTERRALMMSRSWGLTTTYNHVHNSTDRDPEVIALRDLHAEIDHAVLDAYGWDLDLEIGHHPTKIGTRWTVSPRARFELLDLLLEENHRRAG